MTPAIRPYDRSQLAAAGARDVRGSRARPLEARVIGAQSRPPSWSVRVEFFHDDTPDAQARQVDERAPSNVDERKRVVPAPNSANSSRDNRVATLAQASADLDLQLPAATSFAMPDPRRAAAAYNMLAVHTETPAQDAGKHVSVRA
jgi:hypothetical protein